MSDQGWQQLGRFGPFFAVSVLDDHDETTRAAAGWLSLTALVEEPDVLTGRIAAVRRALAGPAPGMAPGGVPARVAVSVTQLGLTARLVAVALAAAVDRLELPGSAGLVFQDRLGGPYPLGVPSPRGAQTLTPAGWPDALLALVRPITQAAIDVHGLSAQVGRGNVASAVASAVRMITAVDPGAGTQARALAGLAFATAELHGTGSSDDAGVFRRRSCCLIYRLATDPVFCGDCVLAGRDRSSRPSSSRPASGPSTRPSVPHSST